MGLVEFLKGLVTKSYKFFAPSISATSTAVDESVVIELSKRVGTSVEAVTNGLGKCVGYVSTNIVEVSNGASKTVGTVIDFASRQVVATEELLATEGIAGAETIAAGSTATEITATTTTTALMSSPVAVVGACVITAIGGYKLGESIGNNLNEKYPNFWGGQCADALYNNGCTIGQNRDAVITYMDINGKTFIPYKSVEVIKAELAKVGASIGSAPDPGTVPDYSGVTRLSVMLNTSDKPIMEFKFDIPNIYYTTPFLRYGTSNVYYLAKDVKRPCIYRQYYTNGAYDYSYMAQTSGGNGYPVYYVSINTSYTFRSQPSNLGVGSFYYYNEVHDVTVPIFKSYEAALNYINTGKFGDLSNVTLPDSYVIPPEPVIIPNHKIRIGDLPATDDDSKSLPIPGIEPAVDPDLVPKPGVDPVKKPDPVADNPNPFPASETVPGDHIPDLPNPVIKPPDILPIMPNPSMVASALSRVFNPTQAQLDSLGQYMWSASRLEDLLKLFQNPADGVISLHAIYGTPSTSGEAEIKLGYLSTGVSAAVVTNQFVVIDCGTISINEKYNNATDYAPYTTVQIYLPFIGIQTLNPFDVIEGLIKCTYKIDVYTGACIAQLNVVRDGLDGVIYEFAGNCSYQIPLTSGNYLQAVANVIGGVVGGGVLGGPAGAALGAGRAMLHSNVEVSRSGNLSANAGILGNRKPYFIITRSVPKDAYNYSEYYGYPCNKTIYLKDCSGFTRVKDIILHTSATQEERDEIMKLLKTGIYI